MVVAKFLWKRGGRGVLSVRLCSGFFSGLVGVFGGDVGFGGWWFFVVCFGSVFWWGFLGFVLCARFWCGILGLLNYSL